MKHPETRKQIPGAKAAVMFIHGIVGTPDHFRNMVPLEASVPEHWSVYNLRLPGHGGNVGDFAHSSMCEWKRHVWEAFAELAKDHEKVILVGHSMGTLFALQLAAENPEKTVTSETFKSAAQQQALAASPPQASKEDKEK